MDRRRITRSISRTLTRAGVEELRSSSVRINRNPTMDGNALLRRNFNRGRRASVQPQQVQMAPVFTRRLSVQQVPTGYVPAASTLAPVVDNEQPNVSHDSERMDVDEAEESNSIDDGSTNEPQNELHNVSHDEEQIDISEQSDLDAIFGNERQSDSKQPNVPHDNNQMGIDDSLDSNGGNEPENDSQNVLRDSSRMIIDDEGRANVSQNNSTNISHESQSAVGGQSDSEQPNVESVEEQMDVGASSNSNNGDEPQNGSFDSTRIIIDKPSVSEGEGRSSVPQIDPSNISHESQSAVGGQSDSEQPNVESVEEQMDVGASSNSNDGDEPQNEKLNDSQPSTSSAFPGHGSKPGRISFFSQGRMDSYVQGLLSVTAQSLVQQSGSSNQRLFQAPTQLVSRRQSTGQIMARPPLSRFSRMSLDTIPEEPKDPPNNEDN